MLAYIAHNNGFSNHLESHPQSFGRASLPDVLLAFHFLDTKAGVFRIIT